ncbi:hypothetical protein ATERTT37_004366 [Aspergillus terreus]
MPSNPGPHANNYMGLPPPVRTGTSSSYYPESRPYDDQSAYGMRSPGGMAPSPISPYDNQPYHDYTGGHPWQTNSPAPASYSPQPQYMAVGNAVTRAESPRPIPYRQPSPGFNQVPIGTAITRAETPRVVPPPSLLQSGRKPAPNSYRDV